MTTANETGKRTQLPGNDGSWFLKAVGISTAPTELGDVGGNGESTTELVSELWNTADHPDPFEGWAPDELSHTIENERNFRWSLIILAAMGLLVVSASVVWLMRSSESRAAAQADDYLGALITIRTDLPDAQTVLALVTEPDADASQFPDVIPTVADLRADAETALELAAEPLPSAWPLASSQPFEELAPTRETTSREATTAEAIARRLGEVLDYRTLFAGFLDSGELPTRPEQDLSELNLRLASAAADSATILSSLPGDAAFAQHTELARAALERFTTWQVDYVDALRTDDLDAVGLLLEELAAMRADLDRALVAGMAQIRNEVDESIISLAASLDAAIAEMQ